MGAHGGTKGTKKEPRRGAWLKLTSLVYHLAARFVQVARHCGRDQRESSGLQISYSVYSTVTASPCTSLVISPSEPASICE